MSRADQTDRDMLDAIRRGDSEAWSQLIDKYHGRLLRFAATRVPQTADAEDIVQSTFTSLLKVVDSLDIRVSLETYLFAISRNEIILRCRQDRARRVCLIQDLYSKSGNATSADALAGIASLDPSASRRVSHNEQRDLAQTALGEALRRFVQRFQEAHEFRSLKMAELLFYCQLSIREVAEQLNVNEGLIRTFKHRCLRRIQKDVARLYRAKDASLSCSDDLLTGIWEEQRLSCVKRSTLGAFLLGDLSREWFDYVDFHLSTMGCHFCRASFKDLQEEQNSSKQHERLRRRIVTSTVGFLPRPERPPSPK